MKMPTHEAAVSLRLHPTNLMLYLADMGLSLDDIWPEIDSEWVDALRAKDWDRFGAKAADSPTTAHKGGREREPKTLQLSRSAAILVEKLWRHGKWGGEHVSFVGMQKLAHLSAAPLRDAVRQLDKLGLILIKGTDGPYSLNPARRADIERIAASPSRGC